MPIILLLGEQSLFPLTLYPHKPRLAVTITRLKHVEWRCYRYTGIEALINPLALRKRVFQSASDQYTNCFKAQGGFFKHGQALFALLAQGNQFAVTHARVNRLQSSQACQFFFRVGGQAALCFGHTFCVAWRNLGFTGVDLRREVVTLRLNRTCWRWREARFPAVRSGFRKLPVMTGRCRWHRAGSAGRQAAGNGPIAAPAGQPLR